MIDVLFLWHMHQPSYRHPLSGRPVLPWVRLHGCSGYLDMARALERHPRARVTVNFVPSLVEQIEALLAGEKDELERLFERPADALDEVDTQLVIARSFSVRWSRAIDPRPRYAELYAQRSSGKFRPADLRDLECLFLLSWLGFAAREDEPLIDELDRKGRGYSEADKAALLAAARGAVARVLPSWRRLAERGQVELSTSPYFHPIVPLLADSNVARRSRPGDPLPPRVVRPEDAREQIRLAQELHQRVFGRPATGMWPPEGSLSPEAVALYAESGVKWLAGDEETLARSFEGVPGAPDPRRARGGVWRHAGVDLVFRNRELSDRIGFRYGDMPAVEAVADLVAGARAAAGDDGVVGVFLDGENAWEAYPGRGAPFLDRLYAAMEEGEKAGTLRARAIGETVAARGPGAPLEKLHSGSWIDASFRIWIGDPEKNRAWAKLAQARDRLAALEKARGKDDPGVALARRHLLCAEGSDWFWWFGEPFTSSEDPIFDDLFRSTLKAAYRALGDEPPADLAEPIMAGKEARHAAVPTALIQPHLDGKIERYFEWLGAARYDIGTGVAMADRTHPIERVHVGFDDATLFMRLDPTRIDRRRVAASRMLLRVVNGEHNVSLRVQLGAPDGGDDLRGAGGRVAALDVVELALPFALFEGKPRDEIRVWMTLEFADVPFARIPRDGVFSVTLPWAGWEDEHWSA